MPESKEQQLFFMRYALRLAERGRCTTPPNPWVGCVLVKEGEILGEGYHIAPGKPHAEIEALHRAGILAKGATAYVTLEPCAHYGRTPPCTKALLEAGVGKVVIPFLDPDPQVAGKGVKELRDAGVEVVVGVGADEAELVLEPYLYQRKTGRPFCVLKAAVSLDGRIAAADGSSQWITGEEARMNAHRLRAESQAIIVGTKTALIDKPQLTVRGIAEMGKQPLRVVVDAKGEVPAEGALFDPQLAPTLIATTHHCPDERKKEWENKGVEVRVFPENKGRLDLEALFAELGKRQVIQALVEGGGYLYAACVVKGLAQRCVLYVGGCVLGPKGAPLFPMLEIPTMQEVLRWKLQNVGRFGNDVRLDYKIA